MKIFDHLDNYKNNVAVITDNNEIFTYEDIISLSNNLYEKINHRCLVLQLCENSIGSLVGYVSFLRNGIVPMMIDKNINTDLLINLISIYKPEYLYVPILTLSFTLPQYEVLYNKNNYFLIKTNYDKSYSLHDDLALLLTTSGSTGSPKFVRQSYQNIISNAISIIEYLDINIDERAITTLPMNYTYGLSIINTHLVEGATILLTSKTLMQKEFWDFFKLYKATSFGGVPYTYEMLKRLRFFSMNLPSLKTMTQAGGKLSVDITKEFSEFAQSKNIKFVVMYGQTEATARMSYLDPDYSLVKCGSIGKEIPGGKFKLGEDKELIYEGDNVTLGYATCGEDLIKEDENNGVLFTGDIAEKDEDGFYYIVGRKKRFIKIFGSRINLDEIEQLLKTIVTECACTGIDDKLSVYLISKEKEKDIKNILSKKLLLHTSSFEIKIIDSIPKNESGKILYTKL